MLNIFVLNGQRSMVTSIVINDEHELIVGWPFAGAICQRQSTSSLLTLQIVCFLFYSLLNAWMKFSSPPWIRDSFLAHLGHRRR